MRKQPYKPLPKLHILDELADYLDYQELKHDVFDMKVYRQINTFNCGTRGCAMGELPFLFPDIFGFKIRLGDTYWIVNKKSNMPITSENFGHYLGILDPFQCKRLNSIFNPTLSNIYFLDDGVRITPEMVANQIRKFIHNHYPDYYDEPKTT